MRRVRIFGLWRAALSVLLGFLIPLSYAILLSAADDYVLETTPDFLVWPFMWPRPLWIMLMGRQPREGDLAGGLVFMAVCNTVLYGSVVYGALLMLSIVRAGRVSYDPPPPPEHQAH